MTHDPAPEAPLWALLDRLGLPFRHTCGELLAAQSGPTVVALPGHPIAPGATPFAFDWRAGDDPTLPPARLDAHLPARGWHPADLLLDRRAERALAVAVAALRGPLGPGTDSATSNTRARRWVLGQARVEVMAFPPRLNPGLAPGQRRECLLILHPGWLPPLSVAYRDWIAGFQPLGPMQPPFAGPNFAPERWHRLPAPPARQGYGAAPGGQGFVAVAGTLARAIPRADLLAVEREVLTPARGIGQVVLMLRHAPAGVAGVRPHRLTVCSAAYGPDALATEARALAGALSLPLTEQTWPDA